MQKTQGAFDLIGRLLLVALFLPAGVSKIAGFEGTVGYFTSLGLPAPTLAVVATIVIEVLGSLALLFGYQTRIAAVVLAGFTLIASIVGHAFWAAPADQAFVAQLMFFKNVAVIGGLLVLASVGAGKFSLDSRKLAA